VVFVGGGPAGLAGAIELAKLVRADNETGDGIGDIEIAVLDKAAGLGEHVLSGAVINPAPFLELFPDVDIRDMPFRAPVTDERVYMLREGSALRIPTPPTMKNHGNHIASLCEVVRWMGERAEALGRFMASYATLARLPPPEPADVRVAPLVRRVADLETRMAVEVIGGQDLTVRADPDQLEQALINLVRNAVDATLEAGGNAGGKVVSIRWITRTGKLHLLVEDQGPGLSDTGNLFVPFFTTKPGGSGIGLVLSRQIAEGHGGTLELENRGDGTGARARMVLPLDAA
jgi:signal transduction histidine kinase